MSLIIDSDILIDHLRKEEKALLDFLESAEEGVGLYPMEDIEIIRPY